MLGCGLQAASGGKWNHWRGREESRNIQQPIHGSHGLSMRSRPTPIDCVRACASTQIGHKFLPCTIARGVRRAGVRDGKRSHIAMPHRTGANEPQAIQPTSLIFTPTQVYNINVVAAVAKDKTPLPKLVLMGVGVELGQSGFLREPPEVCLRQTLQHSITCLLPSHQCNCVQTPPHLNP